MMEIITIINRNCEKEPNGNSIVEKYNNINYKIHQKDVTVLST